MGFFFAFLFFLAIVAVISVPIIVAYTRNQKRDQLSFERGLKMVPLLIHLPPISEDIEGGGRDSRDITEENISKAQVLYNIMAGTYEKGLKRRIYGQQHFAIEIISAHGFVYFYTTVPVNLIEVVRQAIVSAYPSARLEETEERNIFSSVGKASATTGGELLLKDSFAYPIATYLDSKRDAMQAMLNALSTVGKEDGAAIQFLMRPADPGWRRVAHDLASSKRKGNDNTGGAKAMGVAKDFASAFVKPPEKGEEDKPELSSLDQQVLDSIDDKTRYPAFEVLIRVVASSNVSQRAQGIAANIVSSFALFDAQGKNGFRYEPAKDIDELVTGYIMKFFPPTQKSTILNSVELATMFHFPDQRSMPTSQLERQDSKQVDGPRNMPENGLLLGYNVFRGVKKPIRLAIGDRQRHMYVVGQTGTGKSTFLENLAVQDMMDGNGFAFVDPHGDTAEKLLSMVPKERSEDVIYFSPADMEYPMGLNLFEYDNPDQKDFIIQEVLNMLQKLYDPQHQGIMGPRYEDMFRNAALAVMADPNGGTFIEIPQLFRDPQFLKEKLTHVKDQTVLDFWQKQFPSSQRSNEAGEVTAWFVSKFGAFLSNEMMRNIIGQTKSAFNLRDIMDNKKILLVNLSKGRTGDLNSKLLGMIFVMKFQAAAMSRANIPESQRIDFSLYVDEFQNFSTDSFATIMSEARKYHLNLIVANQFTTQLTEEIRDAVFGNMGTIVAFRIGQNDVDSLSRYFQPTFDGDDLLRVPNYNTIIRTLVGGVPTQPFSMSTLPPLGEPNAKLSDALKQLSAAKFGKPKATVEREIFGRIATKEVARVPGMVGAGSQGAFGGAANPFAASAPAAAGAAQPGFAGGAGAFGAQQRTASYAPAGPQPAMGSGFGAPTAATAAPASPWNVQGRAPAQPAMSQPAATPFGAPGAGNGFAQAPQGHPVGSGAGPSMAPSAGRTQPAAGGSFLDDWLDKRGSATPNPRPVWGGSPAQSIAPQAPATQAPVHAAAAQAAQPAQPTLPVYTAADSLAAGNGEANNEDEADQSGGDNDTPTGSAVSSMTGSPAPAYTQADTETEHMPDQAVSASDDVGESTMVPEQPDATVASVTSGAQSEDKPRKKRKKRRKHKTDASMPPGQPANDSAEHDTRPRDAHHGHDRDVAHGNRTDDRQHGKPAAGNSDDEANDVGIVTIGNHYDRNRVPNNHVLTEHDQPHQIATPSTSLQDDADASGGKPEANPPAIVDASADEPAAAMRQDTGPGTGPDTQPTEDNSTDNDVLNTTNKPAASDQPQWPQPPASKPDWLPRATPQPHPRPGPQLAYPSSMEDDLYGQPYGVSDNKPSSDIPRTEPDIVTLPSADEPEVTEPQQALPSKQTTEVEPELAKIKFHAPDPNKPHFSHGDTIYIDTSGTLRTVPNEAAADTHATGNSSHTPPGSAGPRHQ